MGFPEASIEAFGGKIERLWNQIPDNYAVVDISETGSTRDANNLTVFQSILAAQLVLYVNAEKLEQVPSFARKLEALQMQLEIIRRKE